MIALYRAGRQADALTSYREARQALSEELGITPSESLRDLVHGRLLALPRESRDYLLAAAAHAHPTVAVTEAPST